MKRFLVASIILGLCVLMFPPAPASADAAAEKAALASAQAWLGVVDGGNYARSYQESASVFRGAISQANWVAALDKVRKPLGRVVSRKATAVQYTTSIPGAPAGKYVVIEFTTSFEKKSGAVERVTPMLDKDGKWRVSGYFIR